LISIVIISKDEESLDGTLTAVSAQAQAHKEPCEIIVVDSSDGRLDSIRLKHESRIKWVQFARPQGVRVTIPHQRNEGVRQARGSIIVFTDAGCQPDDGWLVRLVEPLLGDEKIAYGLALATASSTKLYNRRAQQALEASYVTEFSTINLAFHREVFHAVNGFDEQFAYGSDVDFSWRIVDMGYKCRSVPAAVVRHDWGKGRRQLRRSYVYGKARVRLHRKHSSSLIRMLRNDPMVIVYPVFLLGLPLTIVFPVYPALLIIPAWRNRADGPMRVIVDHLVFGVGALAELING
jgi:GT2 family glycosyltransferase